MRAILAALVSATLGASLLAAPACILPSISPKNADAGPTPTAAADAGAPAAVQGASCAAVSSSIALCQYISSCPQLVLSPQVFPQCGFRIHGSAIDPECLCNGHYLCPIGNPSTCAEAAQAASGDTTYDSVCLQSVQGSCLDLTAAGGGGSAQSLACQTCLKNCDNVPSCVDACGC